MTRLVWFWFLLPQCGLFPFPRHMEGEKEKFIRTIEIKILNVFQEEEMPFFIYNLANELHIKTRKQFIREELLFRLGDKYDPALLEESERNLREYDFIGEAIVAPVNETDDSVDVSVQVEDQWSTIARPILNARGGFEIKELNLLGLGKRVHPQFRRLREGNMFKLDYYDPHFMRSRWTANISGEYSPYIKNFYTEIVRPFYSLDTRWAWSVAGNFEDETVRLFEEGVEYGRFGMQSGQIQTAAAWSTGDRLNRKIFQLSYEYINRNFSVLNEATPVPEDDLTHSLGLTFNLENIHFEKVRNLDNFQVTEDLVLGSLTQLRLNRTGLPVPTGENRFEFSAERRQTYRIFGHQYFLAAISFDTQFRNLQNIENTMTSVDLKYYSKKFVHQTVAVNMEFVYGHDLTVPLEFVLGGDSRLRGYPTNEFSGAKSLLINIEDRIFSSLHILTIALGGVVFVDAGNIWQEAESLDLLDLRYAAGVGLRLGLTKSPGNRIIRIDVALPINRDGGATLTVGLDQHFTIDNDLDSQKKPIFRRMRPGRINN